MGLLGWPSPCHGVQSMGFEFPIDRLKRTLLTKGSILLFSAYLYVKIINMNKCLNCGKDVKNKYCGVSCQNTHQNTGKKLTSEQIEKMKFSRNSKWKTFDVCCEKCKKIFKIEEYNVLSPKKDKYFCSRSCANSRIFSKETNFKKSASAKKSEKVKKANKANSILRKGLYFGGGVRREVELIKTPCLFCGGSIEHKKNKTKKYHAECWRKCSGGFKEGSSRGKSGWYNGYWCDSSWELAWVIYNLEHDIKFERNKIGFEYIFENKKSLFYPDFIVDGKYIEIKNYNSSRLEAKLKFFPHHIDVLYKKELKIIFEYVIEKFGKNYISLYEK